MAGADPSLCGHYTPILRKSQSLKRIFFIFQIPTAGLLDFAAKEDKETANQDRSKRFRCIHHHTATFCQSIGT